MTPRTPSTRSMRTPDPADPKSWGDTVELMTFAMADHMWGASHWYRGAAHRALCAALGLDADEQYGVLIEYHRLPTPTREELLGDG